MSLTPATFSDLYERYARDVFRYSLYLTADRALAEDITAESFLRIWAMEGEVRVSSVKAYLLAIARNLYLHEMRGHARKSELDPALPAAESLERDSENREELERVLADLQRLPEADRTAVLLRAEDGLTYEEIAAVLGISVAAAKVKVHRARKLLAERQGRSATQL